MPRLRAWIADDSEPQALRLGDRLWLLEHGGNPWFPESVARRTTRVPAARRTSIEVEDGPLSRPDITAGFVRRLTARTPVGAVVAGRRVGRSADLGARSVEGRAARRDPPDAAQPHTGQGEVPLRFSSIAARRSCSASEAAAGSPLPPTALQVP